MVDARIEHLCKASVLLDATDLPGLVELESGMRELAQVLDRDGDSTSALSLRGLAESVQRIVLREADDLEGAMCRIREQLDQLCAQLSGAESGQSAVDGDLLSAWLEDCMHVLDEIEGQASEMRTSRSGDATLAEVRRRVHTLKGECGVIPLPRAQEVLHELENELEIAAGGVSDEMVDRVFAVVDWMRRYTSALREDPHALAPSMQASEGARPGVRGEQSKEPVRGVPHGAAMLAAPVLDDGRAVMVRFSADAEVGPGAAEFLSEAREHLERSEKALLDLEQQPENAELINTVFRAFHTIKGVAGFMKLAPIVTLAHAGECLLDGARSGKLVLDSGALSLILKGCDLLGQLLNLMEGKEGPTQRRFEQVREALERASRGEKVDYAALGVSTGEPTHAGPVSQSGAVPQNAAVPEQSAKQSVRSEQTVKVNTLRMDALVDMVGELVIAHQMVVQDPNMRSLNSQQLQRNVQTVGKIVRDLQTVSMSLRMVPIKTTFQKMARLVRDLASKGGKRITFVTEGDEVELDRNMVEIIADPLVHMVRNSCDHGLETPEQRSAAGKSESGRLCLRAFHSAGAVVIEIQDDGRGLSRERILSKAIERGIYEPDRPMSEIPDSEVFNLIFLPGFSTAEKVTDISGRGVGMDVVRRNIEGLRGKIDIRSIPGRGTTFSLRLPLTLAIIDGLVVRLGSSDL